MKKLLVLTLLMALATSVSAQKPLRWTQLRGPNVGGNRLGLMFDEFDRLIAVVPLGYYVSSNNGNTWDYHSVIFQKGYPCSSEYYNSPYDKRYSGLYISPSGEYYFYFRSCDYSDSNVIGIYRSKDKGATWEHVMKKYEGLQVATGRNNSLLAFVRSASPLQNQYSLFQSIDKGNSWTEIYEPPSYNFEIVGSNDTYLYALMAYQDGGGELMRMSYSDLNMEAYGPPSSGYYVTCFTQISNNLFLTVASDGRGIVSSSDGERGWDSVGHITASVGLIRGRGDTIFCLQDFYGTKQSLSFSSDLGRSWNLLTSISPFMSDYSAWSLNCERSDRLLFENDTALYLSSDRGSSWKEIGIPIDSIDQILLTEDGKIFAEDAPSLQNGYYPRYRATNISNDKGLTWHKTLPDYEPISAIGKGLGGNIIAVAPQSTASYFNNVWIYDSSAPNEWRRQSVVENISEHPLISSDGSQHIYIASGNSIFRSDDNAFTWTNLEVPITGNSIYSLDVSSDGTVYYGTYPELFRSGDNGVTWTKLIPIKDIINLSYIKTFGPAGILLGTGGDGLHLSTDKGNSWSRIDGNNFDTVTCIAINNIGEIAAGTDHGLWILDSARRNWTKIQFGLLSNIRIGGIAVGPTGDFFVGTYGSSVWIGTRNYSSTHSSGQPISSMKIFPDPAIENFNVSIEPTPNIQERLELYDLLGRRIAVLAEGEYPDGKVISFETSALPSGIYTVIQVGPQFRQTQKLVVRH